MILLPQIMKVSGAIRPPDSVIKIRRRSKRAVALLLWSLTLWSSFAQDFNSLATSMPRMKAVISKLCAETPEFAAEAKVEVYGKEGNLQTAMTIGLALRDENLRQEINTASMPQIPPNAKAGMVAAKLDKILIITRVDRKRVYMAFPGVNAYLEFPISDAVLSEITERTKSVNIQKADVGQETVDGRTCTKTRIVVTEPNRPTGEAILWRDEDLKWFPVKIEIVENGRKTKFDFKDVQVGKPDRSLFEIPTNYVKFPNTSEILQYAKTKAQANARPDSK